MSDSRIKLEWGPKKLEDLIRQVDNIRGALLWGADESIWPPGLTVAECVSRLVELSFSYKHAIESAPCEASRIGENTYECRHDNLCRVCKWRSDVIRELQESHGTI